MPQMPLNQLNELLERIGEANNGCNHGSQYALYELPPAGTLREALDLYFSGLRTSNTPPQPAEKWCITSTVVHEPHQELCRLARNWFYKQEFSPKVEVAHAEEVISDFIAKLHAVVGNTSVFQVRVNPPMWYDCIWQDYAFDSANGRWLLHLGFSD